MTQPKLSNAKLAAQLIADDLEALNNRKAELTRQREQVNQQIDAEIAQCDEMIAKWTPTLKQD